MFRSETAAGKTDFYYKNILAVAETQQYFCFILSENHGQMYDKNSLEGGSTEQFKEFLSDVTGKEIVFIK